MREMNEYLRLKHFNSPGYQLRLYFSCSRGPVGLEGTFKDHEIIRRMAARGFNEVD